VSLDSDKILKDLKAIAEPELQKRADELRALFLKEIDEFVDSSRVHKLDDLLKRAAGYEVQAVLATDRSVADQYAKAAEEVLRQIKLLVIAERIVASREVAAMIEAAAVSVWTGFKSVAAGALNVVIKGVMSGLLGPAGGMLADVAGGFLGEALGDVKPNSGNEPST
jgi:hypothetical protein